MKNAWSVAMRLRMVVLSLVVSTTLIVGCSGGGDSGGGGTPSTAQTGTVAGQVTSAANGSAVTGATVSTTAGSTTSAADGSFTVPAGAGERTVIHVEATGFAETFPVARVTAGQTTNLGVRLLPTGVTTPVTVANGGTVTVPNSSAQVSIPANGLVPKSGSVAAGTVNVAVTPINPAVDVTLMPGDFTAVSAGGGSAVPIESFGAMLIDIRDNSGTRYTLAAGKSSTIRIPVGTLSPNPPATIPLFFFDESTGLWKEEGTAALQGTAPNQYYEGTVTHFSYWNADIVQDTVFVTGCLRDANNQPVANAWIRSNGSDYSGIDLKLTASDGSFRVGIRRGGVATLSVIEVTPPAFAFTTVSNVVNVGPSNVDFTLPTCLVKSPGPLTITTAALPAGSVGVSYSFTLTATGGVPGYTWSLNPGSNPLPAGLSLSAAGVITGTPSIVGTTIITVKVIDSAGSSVTKQLSVTINPPGVVPVSITSPSLLPAGTVSTAYSTTLAASGGTGPLSWSVVSGALPAGVALNAATGQISGRPTTAGVATFTIQVEDSGNPKQTNQKQFSLPIGSGSSGGGGGTLTVSGAPANVGGTFVADERFTTRNVGVGGIFAVVGWGEVPSAINNEVVVVVFSAATGQINKIQFSSVDPGVGVGGVWTCSITSGCPGATIDRAAGTFTLTNVVLTDLPNSNPPITVNGTLTFTPF